MRARVIAMIYLWCLKEIRLALAIHNRVEFFLSVSLKRLCVVELRY